MSGLTLKKLVLCGCIAMAPLTSHAEVNAVPVFTAGENGCDTYRIPAVVETGKGTLLAFAEARWSNGSDSGDIDLVVRRSTNGGTAWGPILPVVNDGTNTCGNPCPIVDRKTDTVVLLFTKNLGTVTQEQIVKGEAPPRTVFVTTSKDDGATWSVPVDISAQVRKPEWRWYATGPGHGIQLKDGRMVAPCDHSTGPTEDDMHSHVILSDDAGATWRIGGVLEGRTDESTVAELEDGSLYLNVRNYRGTNRRGYAFSHDRGETWSAFAEDPALVEPVCQASVLVLGTNSGEGKSFVVFSNPADVERRNMTLRLSTDHCRTWPYKEIVLWPGPAAYSDLVRLPHFGIGCLFECGDKRPYERIVFTQTALDAFSSLN